MDGLIWTWQLLRGKPSHADAGRGDASPVELLSVTERQQMGKGGDLGRDWRGRNGRQLRSGRGLSFVVVLAAVISGSEGRLLTPGDAFSDVGSYPDSFHFAQERGSLLWVLMRRLREALCSAVCRPLKEV